jgi:hypothetical protein
LRIYVRHRLNPGQELSHLIGSDNRLRAVNEVQAKDAHFLPGAIDAFVRHHHLLNGAAKLQLDGMSIRVVMGREAGQIRLSLEFYGQVVKGLESRFHGRVQVVCL